MQPKSLSRGVGSNVSIWVCLCHKLLAARVNEQSDEIRPHVVTPKVSYGLWYVALIEVDIHEHQTVEIFVCLEHTISVWSEDTRPYILLVRIRLGFNACRRIFLQTIDTEALERRQGPRTRLNGLRRGDQVSPLLAGICRWIRVLPRGITRGDWPGGNVDLLATSGVQGLEERVHVLPAVELAETADIGICNGHENVTCAIAIDEPFGVAWLYLAAMVDNVSIRRYQHLCKVTGRKIDLRESHGHIARACQHRYGHAGRGLITCDCLSPLA